MHLDAAIVIQGQKLRLWEQVGGAAQARKGGLALGPFQAQPQLLT